MYIDLNNGGSYTCGIMAPDMDLKAEELRFIDLLGENTRIFTTPIFQREYKWDEEQREALWEDIMTIDSDVKPVHFVGQVILVEEDDPNLSGSSNRDDVQVYKIVDGQQRLTTLSLLVCAIRDLESLPDDNKNVESILTTYDRNGDPVRTLRLLDEDDAAYEKVYSGHAQDADSDHPIKECYDDFTNKLEDLNSNERKSLLANAVHNINLVRTTCGGMSAAYQVFQTQNERGLELTPLNLSKTKLMEESVKVEIDEEEVRRRWEEICSKLEKNDRVSSAAPRRAITHYLIVDEMYPTPVRITTKDFYNSFVNALDQHRGEKEIRKFIRKLEEYTQLYIDIHEEAVTKYRRDMRDEINRRMRFFQSKNAHAPIVLLYLVKNVDDPDLMNSLLRQLTKFNVRLNLQDAKSANHRDSMYQIVQALKKENQADWEDAIKELIEQRTVEDTQLKELLRTRQLPHSEFTRELLRELEEEYYRAGKSANQVDLNEVELEHIAPKSVFRSKKYSTWEPIFDNDPDKFELYKSRIGNITLLEGELNASIGNGTFDDKCEIYDNSDLTMSENIPSEFEDWGYTEIEDRTKSIADDIVTYWSV